MTTCVGFFEILKLEQNVYYWTDSHLYVSCASVPVGKELPDARPDTRYNLL